MRKYEKVLLTIATWITLFSLIFVSYKHSNLVEDYNDLVTKYNKIVKEKKTVDTICHILLNQEPYTVHEVKTVECIGEFKITYYCGCDICNGVWGNITYRGTIPRPKHTIAVDPNVIPLGSKVIIEGIEYTAEDTGNKIIGNKIDVYVSSHEEALEKGTETLKVYKEVN